ncbi:MAG: hypothetical protein ACRDS9_27610, partial [Pseudonocardiaceae bacterium]
FGTVVIDESQGFKSETSRRFLALASVRGAIDRLIELSGTPAPNGLLDLWSQVYLLDQGRTLGATKADYIARWFDPIRYVNDRPVTWVPKPGAEEEIHAAIAPLAISATNTTLALPEVSIEDVPVALPADLLDAYHDFKRALVLDIVTTAAATAQAELDADGDASNTQGPPAGSGLIDLEDRAAWVRQRVVRIVADSAGILTGKLMQFASGTMYTDPEDPSRPYEVLHSAKLEMTDYLVRNSGDSPVLVAYHYRSDVRELVRFLTRAGHRTEVFDGSREMVRRWNAREIAVMLLHPASAGHGLNLQHGGSRMIWYTLPFGLGHYMQTNGRLRRPGQTEPVTIHRLLATGTYDTRMPAILAAKQRLHDNLVSSVNATSAPPAPSTTSPDPINLVNAEVASGPDAPGTGDIEARALAAEIAEDLRESLETVLKEHT